MDRFLQLMNEVTTLLNETNQLLNKTETLMNMGKGQNATQLLNQASQKLALANASNRKRTNTIFNILNNINVKSIR
jgi:hypothetical protein